MSSPPLSIEQALLRAKAYISEGELKLAQQMYQAILQKNPTNLEAIKGIRIASGPRQQSNNSGLDQDQINALSNLYAQGQLQEALTQGALLEERHPNVLFLPILLGAVYIKLGNNEKAVSCYQRALSIKPDDAEVHYHMGIALNNLKNYHEAITCFRRALSLNHDDPGIYDNLGNTLKKAGHYEEAIAYYHKALEINPDNFVTYNELGNTLHKLDRNTEAVAIYQRALDINPDNAELHYNLGNALSDLDRKKEAVVSYQRSIELKPDNAKTHYNLGNSLSELRRHEEAIASFYQAFNLDNKHISAYCSLLHEAGYMCDWTKYEDMIPGGLKSLKFGSTSKEVVAAPFSLVALIDDAAFHRRASESFAAANYLPDMALGTLSRKSDTKKIRIGYFSSDFRKHPVMHLMAEMYELHDRSRFEIHAFSFGPGGADDMRARLIKNVDAFHDVTLMRDIEIAALSRSLHIDIAVDLNGYTAHARTSIFTYRAAPIQAHYLGYPGTMGASYFDYMIADPIMIPPAYQKFYTEKIAYLPNSYQVNNSSEEISDKAMSRADAGLPEEAFVFCCFNNTFKIKPDVFDVWMRLLTRIDGSVLWLFKPNQTAENNLIKEAIKRGVSPDRLIFASRVPLSEHLARHRLADLFLDTFNYNAHATGSGSLWAGLPVLTKMGESFASRAGGSLLSAVELPELITTTIQEYEDTALRLATHPVELNALKEKLGHNLKTTTLFNPEIFTKHIEAAYTEMLRRLNENVEHDHIYVKN